MSKKFAQAQVDYIRAAFPEDDVLVEFHPVAQWPRNQGYFIDFGMDGFVFRLYSQVHLDILARHALLISSPDFLERLTEACCDDSDFDPTIDYIQQAAV